MSDTPMNLHKEVRKVQTMHLREKWREALHELIYEALLRWNIDQEIGSSSALSAWIDDFISERDD